MKFVGFLRGINVGGHRKILMKDLKLMLENLGLKKVETYIQSGNFVFELDNDNSNEIQKIV